MQRIVLSVLAFTILAGPPASVFGESDAQHVPVSQVDPSGHGTAAEDVPVEARVDPLAAAIAAQLDDPAFRAASDAKTFAAIAKFYEEADHQPIWVEAGRLTPKARAVVDRLARADEDGLDPARYATPSERLGASPRPSSSSRLPPSPMPAMPRAGSSSRRSSAAMSPPSPSGPPRRRS